MTSNLNNDPYPTYSSNELTQSSTSVNSTKSGASIGGLPSIRSLRSRFQAFSSGSKKSKVVSAPKPILHDSLPPPPSSPPQSEPMAQSLSSPAGPTPPRPLHHPDSSPEMPSSASPISRIRPPSIDSATARRLAGQSASSPRASPTISPNGRRSKIPSPSHSPSHSPTLRGGSRLETIQDRPLSISGSGSIPSPQTKASFRISTDFERSPSLPSLAQLRSGQSRKQAHRKSMSLTSSQAGGTETPPNPPSKIPTPTTSLSPVPSPPSRTSSPKSPSKHQSIIIPGPVEASPGSTHGDRAMLDKIPKSQRPFSPSPIPNQSPSLDANLKDDLAFRRHSINSQTSPVLSSSENRFSGPAPSRLSTGAAGRGTLVEEPTSYAGDGAKTTTEMGLGINGQDPVASLLSDYGSPHSSRDDSPMIPVRRGSHPAATRAKFMAAAANTSLSSPDAASTRFSIPDFSDFPGSPSSSMNRFSGAGSSSGTSRAGTIIAPTTPVGLPGGAGTPRASTIRSSGELDDQDSPLNSRGRRLSERLSVASAKSQSPGMTVTRSQSRQSGNTFGEPSPSPGEGVDTPENEVEIAAADDVEAAEAQDSLDQVLVNRASDLRRTKSAIESVRAYGGQEVSGTGTFKGSSSPVFVLSPEDLGGALYRSASARLASSVPVSVRGSRGELALPSGAEEDKDSRRLSRNRKARSDTYSDRSGGGGSNAGPSASPSLTAKSSDERFNSNTPRLQHEPSTDAMDNVRRNYLASPLDDLIAGLGGRRSSSSQGSHDTHRVIPAPVEELRQPDVSAVPSVQVNRAEDEVQLSVDQMEREIARMEAALKLSGMGEKANPPLGLQTYFDVVAAEKANELEGETETLADRLETPVKRASNQENLAFPSPPNRATLSRSVSQSSGTSSDITPRTARRWSILEVERAYERMKALLGSSSSKSVDAMSETATNAPESEYGDVDVENAFERALRGSSVHASSIATTEDDRDRDAEDKTMLVVKPSNLSPGITPPTTFGGQFPPRVITPTLIEDNNPTPKVPQLGDTPEHQDKKDDQSPTSSDSRDHRQLSSPATSHPPSHKASHESFTGSSRYGSTESLKSSRRHTLNAPPSRQALDDVFSTNDARSGHMSDNSSRRRSQGSQHSTSTSGKLQAPRLARSRTTDSNAYYTSDGAQSDDGWVTPMTSPSSASARRMRSASRLSSQGISLRSEAGKVWARDAGISDQELAAVSTAPASAHTPISIPSGEPITRSTPAPLATAAEVVPLPRSLSSSTNSWFPATPNRHLHFRGTTSDTESTATDPMARIRAMDKLDIFFEYTSVKAEYDKASAERDALLDALKETRSTLIDVRKERDGLEIDLRREKAASKQLKKLLGESAEGRADEIDSMIRARDRWERRARDSIEDAARAKDSTEVLRLMVVEGREREDELQREIVLLGAKLAVAQGGRQLTSKRSKGRLSDGEQSPAAPSSIRYNNGVPSSPRHREAHHVASSSLDDIPISPVRTATILSTPASKVAAAYRDRTSSTASSTGLPALADLSSPLMDQKIAFGAKSSFGSSANGSPLRVLSSGAGGSSGPKSPTQKPLLLAGTLGRIGSTLGRRASRDSTFSSDYGEHLPPQVDREFDPSGSGSTMPELNEQDEAFLSDLSGPIHV
ncbi:hypothetical protein T439DRAFT_345841 [Meredithblackwellia eburnea MCA 4105]